MNEPPSDKRCSRLTLAVLVIVVLAAHWFLSRPAESHLDWLSNFDAAVATARKQGVPILAMFGADWCASCYTLQAHVFNSDDFAAAVEGKFVLLHVDLTNASGTTPEGKIAAKYGVNPIPDVMVIDPADRSMIARARPRDLTVEGMVAFLQRHGE